MPDPDTDMNGASLGPDALGAADGLGPLADGLQAASLPLGHLPEDKNPANRVRQELALWVSPRMREVREIIAEAALIDVTVLVSGETGTGKEVVARAVHYLGPRRRGPFVKVNCAAVARELLESELFGHERGAFTGAHQLKVGKFEAADHGTIFLDEIGDLHPGAPGQAPPRAGGRAVLPCGRPVEHQGRRAGGGGDQPGPRASSGRQASSARISSTG